MKKYTYTGHKIGPGLRQMIQDILEYVQPKTVVDIGCGVGCWLSVFQEHGIQGIGYDGPWVPKERRLIDDFREFDLMKDSIPLVKADLVLCIETAEHLPEERAESFIHELTRIAPVIMFSAAIPNQGGTNHINEQWQSYWMRLFRDNGFVMVDCLRQKWWDNPDIDAFAKQNLFFYVDENKLHLYQKLREHINSLPVDIIHLDMYTQVLGKVHSPQGVIDLFMEIPEILLKKIKGDKKL